MIMRPGRLHILCILGFLALGVAAGAAPYSQQLDLTQAGVTNGAWKFTEIKEVPGGRFLAGGAGESPPIPFAVTASGAHRVWLKIHTDKDKAANFLVIVRAPNGEAVRAERLDAPFHRLAPAKPYLEQVLVREAGFQWLRIELNLEYPGTYALVLSGAVARGGGRKLVAAAYVSNDPAFDPKQNPAVSAAPPQEPSEPPRGLQPVTVHRLHTALYSGVADARKQFEANLIQNGSIYLDPAAMVLMGVNRQQGGRGSGGAEGNYGILTTGRGASFESHSPEFVKSVKAPEGRFVNGAGTAGVNFSLSYPPAIEDAAKYGPAVMLPQVGDTAILSWSVAGEAGGSLDYSSHSIAEFRGWLKRKYGSIAKLNDAWRAGFTDFAEIVPAPNAETNTANWLEFRDFSSKVFAAAVARSVAVVNAVDPQKRPATAQFSNLDLFASDFARRRPNNFEDLILVGLKETDHVSWDGYCADDFMGAEVDLIDSLGRGKKMLVREWNTHNQDVAMAARTYWTMFGKGVKGISLFQFHEGGAHDSYPKWALTNTDMSPRDKLGAFSDAMHEIHRIENIVVEAKKVCPVKPVAIFYNKIDMTLSKAPLASAWGEGIDSPYHVYEMLRGRGYPVTFITDLQIRDGLLKDVGAVVFVDAQHISSEACDAVIDWVNAGGVVIGDTWPGAYTELGHRQDKLISLFGIRSRETKRVAAIKLEESPQGYGEMTVSAINPDTLYNTVMETWQQWDATHPIAKMLGNWMFSGYGACAVSCTAGEVIGMVFGGHPGVVVNQTGKGQSLYVSTMLGSLYGGSCTRYEWDSTHSDLSAPRLLDAFLEFAGVKKLAVAGGLTERQAGKLRVEAPLIDGKGNGIVTLTSYNDAPLPAFPLKIAWPAGVKPPRKLFGLVGGSRQAADLPFTFADGQIALEVPGFVSHATLLAVSESVPLLSLEFPGARRGVAGLVTLTPNQVAKVKVTVHNVSGRAIEGRITVRLPEGWFYDQESVPVAKIAPWASATAEFTIQAPPVCAARRVRPISFLFEGGNTASMPTTEAVWWQAE